MSAEPSAAEIEAGATALSKFHADILGLGVNETETRIVLAAVLPLYRDRMLTELADEIGTPAEGWSGELVAHWLRSKVGNPII